MKEFSATIDQAPLHLLIKLNIGAAEAVDRLLGITHQKQFPRNGLDFAPIGLGSVISCEKQQDLGLEGVGILEFIDKVMREALLQLGAHALIVADEITRLDQEIDKIEAPSFSFQVLIGTHRRLQLLVEQRGKIGVARGNECIEIRLHLVPAVQHLITRQRSE